MIEESGTVLSTEKGFAEVETIRTSSCTACRARHGCGHHAIAQVSASNRMRMKVIDEFSVDVGQKVTIGIPEDTLLQASLWMYFIPLLGLVAGATLPAIWHAGNGISVVLSLSGFFSGLWLAKKKSQKEENNPNFYPKILRITPTNEGSIPLVFTP